MIEENEDIYDPESPYYQLSEVDDLTESRFLMALSCKCGAYAFTATNKVVQPGDVIEGSEVELVTQCFDPYDHEWVKLTDIDTPEGIEQLGGTTRQAYIRKPRPSLNEGKEGRPTEEYLIKSGWIKRPAPVIIGDSFIMDIGRRRQLIFSNINNPNQMLAITEIDDHKAPTDIVVIHNWDYDRWITTELLEGIVAVFKQQGFTIQKKKI